VTSITSLTSLASSAGSASYSILSSSSNLAIESDFLGSLTADCKVYRKGIPEFKGG
jgi:hypothetical protein